MIVYIAMTKMNFIGGFSTVTSSILTCSDEQPSAAKTPDYASLNRRLESKHEKENNNETIKQEIYIFCTR